MSLLQKRIAGAAQPEGSEDWKVAACYTTARMYVKCGSPRSVHDTLLL